MADKDFGVKKINLIGTSGAAKVTSPTTLNLNAPNVAISTDMSVGGQVSLGAGTSISSPGSNILTFGTNSTERLRINSAGDVCVGGHSSNYANSPLEVRGTNAGGDVAIRVTNNSTTSGTQAGIIFTTTTEDYTTAGIGFERGTSEGLKFYVGQSAGGGGFTNATERLRITSAGNLKFVTSGTGIDFSATAGPNDGADTSELLDDYEEGTFTPLFGASVTNPTYTTSAVDGYYTKIGNQVTCWGLIVVNGTPTNGSGNWLITSLPYASASGLSYRQNGIIGYNDVLTNEVNKLYIVGGASYCQIIPNGVTQSNETYSSNPITTGYFSFTITYRI